MGCDYEQLVVFFITRFQFHSGDAIVEVLVYCMDVMSLGYKVNYDYFFVVIHANKAIVEIKFKGFNAGKIIIDRSFFIIIGSVYFWLRKFEKVFIFLNLRLKLFNILSNIIDSELAFTLIKIGEEITV